MSFPRVALTITTHTTVYVLRNFITIDFLHVGTKGWDL